FNTREENQAESFRKMLLAMARDVRVILIKLADRTHNMRTLSDVPRTKWARISSETLEIYAPIAHRLGLNTTYRELQDLSFQHLHPWRYVTLDKALSRSRGRRRDVITRVKTEVEAAFASANIPVQIFGREKTLYSIYSKMDEKHLSFAQVTDIYGFRVIVDNLTACYTSMGVLHQLYKPLPGRFKDYIAIPKINGYQSLHTTLVGPFGTNIEFQMRTEAMHVVAESGVAAHWLYKAATPGSDDSQNLGTQWLQSLLDIQHETGDAAEFWDHVKIDLFPDAVYVFTPKSKIMAMPRGATIVDFAYAIHSDIGHRAVAAKVNGEQVPLRTVLHNGDVIEIVTTPASSPNPAWLGFVRTGKARSKIRHYLKTMALTESQDLGEKMLAHALRAEGIDKLPEDDEKNHPLWEKILRFSGNRSRADLLTDVGLGKRIATILAKRIVGLLGEIGEKPDVLLMSRERFTEHEAVSQGALLLDGSEGTSIHFAKCCKPIPGDNVIGYLGRGEGLVVHTEDCAVAKRLVQRDSERFIAVDWSDEPVRAFETDLLVTVSNGKGVLARVAAAMASAESDITQVQIEPGSGQDATNLRFGVAVRDRVHLAAVMRNVKRATSVLRVQRVKSGV
ncbi:MAG: bifunctional (p)ppGpp synthetase/guanosine-3',5'-bis(diphosphate) 3'-pyrophosphohydrolase, partial [Polaromonas sp.]|nr:bifunctional (p)ppGpp synthetase/guanosine-3',5'-bis(diphosphate) 3'-pyrophosphohydrolase [Polaromonas sp.]